MTNTPEKKTPNTIAFCYVRGDIGFGLKIPEGALMIIQGTDQRIRELVEVSARHAYDGKTLLVPGIPEAKNGKERLAALSKFTGWLQNCLAKEAAVEAWNAAHPKGTRVIVHSDTGDAESEYTAHGRTTTKAHLRSGRIMVRVQYHGENPWTDIDVLTFQEGGAA